ncbi:hypothetical protein ES703_78491 [subsurface metagenome]
MNFKRVIEAFSLAVTFLVCSLIMSYVICSGHFESWSIIFLIVLIIGVVASSLMFLFFTVALSKTKLMSDWYDQTFESPLKRRPRSIFFAIFSAIFVPVFLLAILISFIAGIALIFNEMPEGGYLLTGGWRILAAILVPSLLAYVMFAMAKTLKASIRSKNAKS